MTDTSDTQLLRAFSDPSQALDPRIIEHFDANLMRYEAKQVIYHAGAEPDCVYCLKRGLVKLVSYLPNGQSRIVRLHNAGAWFGLGRVLDEPCEHTAVAVEDIELYRIEATRLKRLRDELPEVYCLLMECWYDYLRRADKWIAEFSTGSLKSRLARLLNFLGEIEMELDSDQIKLLTCEEMAEILGTTPESVSRLLAEMKRQQVLKPLADDNRYRCDMEQLETLAED